MDFRCKRLEGKALICAKGPRCCDFSFLDQEIDIIYSQGGKLLVRSFNIEEKSPK